MKGTVTIDDVARQAGVAISTVSHVVNGTRFVSEATRMAVERAIVASGYIPNSLARSLARSRTNTIGIALSTTSNPYFIELVYAFAAECIPRKWMTLLADTKEDPEVEEKSVRSYTNAESMVSSLPHAAMKTAGPSRISSRIECPPYWLTD